MDFGRVAQSKFARAILALCPVAALLLLTGACSETPRPSRDESAYRIGLITNNPNGLRNIDGFKEGMRALGYQPGRDLTFLGGRTAVPQAELEDEIRAFVAAGADLVFTAGTPTGVAAHRATAHSGIPVVFGVIADPLKAGVMQDLTRPGGNMTGVMLSRNQARRLELLHRLIPDARRILLPYNPEDPAPLSAVAQLQSFARANGIELLHAHARNDREVTALLTNFPPDVEAVFMLPDSTVNRRIADLLALAAKLGLPVSGPSTAQVEAGALLSYGIVHREVGAQAARIADRILRGETPAALPVETAGFYMTINMAAAQRIGLELSEHYLQQADKIIYEDRYHR